MAVEIVFASMKGALARGDRIELRGFGIFNVRPRKMGGWPEPAHRRGSRDPAGQGIAGAWAQVYIFAGYRQTGTG